MQSQNKTPSVLAILVGGGPAPGINSVIWAATRQGILSGAKVIGIRDGFQWLMQGETQKVKPLTIEEVGWIHLRGGTYLGTSRANPTREPKHLENVLQALSHLNVSGLITIGGDDTCFSALKLEQAAGGRLQVVHVPKTIDNDLDLPLGIPTFGFQTARHVGVDIVKSLMVDAEVTSHWYFVVAMGRTAGHLALGIGKATGATLTLIPEEFTERPLRLGKLVDILAGTIIKQRSAGRTGGVVMLAEGLSMLLDPQEVTDLGTVERDQHGHPRLDELNLGELLRREVLKQLTLYGIRPRIVAKNIGYELRCADPIPFDIEYTQDLGYWATKYILQGGNASLISFSNGRFTPIPFEKILDPATGRTRVRSVDISSESYETARRYMIRLGPEDFVLDPLLAKHAATVGLSSEDFRARFNYLIADEGKRQ